MIKLAGRQVLASLLTLRFDHALDALDLLLLYYSQA